MLQEHADECYRNMLIDLPSEASIDLLFSTQTQYVIVLQANRLQLPYELLYELLPRQACGVDLQELAVLHEAARGLPGHKMPHDSWIVLVELLQEHAEECYSEQASGLL